MSYISAHVLDAGAGKPAAGIEVRLSAGDGRQVAFAVTDADGRVSDLGPELLAPGDYTVSFATGSYFASHGQAGFYPRVDVRFTVSGGEPHYHIPLLLGPFAYTTYRGS